MTDDEKPQVTIYTDGGSDPNPGPGGWAALLMMHRADGSSHERELSGNAPDTTNNRMELTAAIEALRALTKSCRVTLYTDSEYLKNGITEWMPGWVAKGWRRKGDRPVQNVDLWQALHAETLRHAIDWQWVKGHAGNEYNERVDQLATVARQQITGIKPGDDNFTADIEIALRARANKSQRYGAWAIRVAPTSGDEPPRIIVGSAESDIPLTHQRLELLAAQNALSQLSPGAAVRFYCPSDYLYNGMRNWIRGWQKKNWVTLEGKPVQHRDLWEALIAETQGRRIQWAQEPDPAPDEWRKLRKIAGQAAREKKVAQELSLLDRLEQFPAWIDDDDSES